MEFSFDSLDTPALTKAHLSEMLHEQLGLNKREAKDYIEAFFEVIAAELVEGQDVKISGFGNFEKPLALRAQCEKSCCVPIANCK